MPENELREINNPENFKLPDDCPRFSSEEKDELKAAGFGCLMPYHFARFREEHIENMIFRSKIFLRKWVCKCQLDVRICIYKANDLDVLCERHIRKKFPTVHDSLAWLGAFQGKRTFPYSQNENPALREQNGANETTKGVLV